ncbi:hypothetical protein CDEST_00060 [Colletotrichum destructivum]|uniref:Uncharacterized protein n=1 Tax=Colletotrichum destructivum TaxID=34406 RepID=A0AAX4HW00_9PEZI|nr:hypothetical protein CDEST_00060 [Colletotrichum destructivum]
MILFPFGRNAERQYTHFALTPRREEEIRRSAVYLGHNENVPRPRRLIHLKGLRPGQGESKNDVHGTGGGASCLPLPLKTTPACCISPPVVVPRLTASVIVDVGKGADGAKPSRLRAAHDPKQDSVKRRRAVK